MKYLWIDSLCIIQDSTADKDKEIACMASIYKNATIVLSAAISIDCGQGFLQNREAVQLRLDASLRLPFFTDTDPDTRAIVDWIYLCPDAYMGFKVLRFAQEPINRRAWTYQESKLAERLLIFGSEPPQWHCKEDRTIYGLDIAVDDLPDPNGYTQTTQRTIEDGETTGGETRTNQEKVPTEDIGRWTEWFPMLENYSRKALTVRTDKLLEIAAMAAEYASEENGRYAAGLWESSLPRSLLWRRDSPSNIEVAPAGYKHSLSWLQTRLFDAQIAKDDVEATSWASRYIAPTWSPMSSNEPIYFEEAATPKLDDLVSDFLYPPVTIHNVHIAPTTSINPYGRLDFAYIDLSGPMRKISWAELTANYVILRAGEPFPYWDYVVADDPSYFAYMAEKYGSSLNPQMLADEEVQHTMDPGDASIFVGEKTVRISVPPKKEPVPRECVDSNESFHPSQDVKHDLVDAIEQAQSSENQELEQHMSTLGLTNVEQPSFPDDECEFWLLEVERSMSPAGLVLKRIRDNMFARVGYFGKNRTLDPEVVYRQPDMLQIRRPPAEFGKLPDGPSGWFESLTRRKIYLV